MNRVLVLAVTLGTSVPQLPPPEAWEKANRATIRLAPKDFSEIPITIRSELVRRGCFIPQPHTNGGRQNVVRGSFIRRGQTDWAVLCSRELTSGILVFRNGDSRMVDELARRPDADYLQTVDHNRIGFSRAISVASAGHILRYYKLHGGRKPPPLTHAGIEDAFVGKASVVRYWHQGKWLELTGAD
jgi:hypothetical protein